LGGLGEGCPAGWGWAGLGWAWLGWAGLGSWARVSELGWARLGLSGPMGWAGLGGWLCWVGLGQAGSLLLGLAGLGWHTSITLCYVWGLVFEGGCSSEDHLGQCHATNLNVAFDVNNAPDPQHWRSRLPCEIGHFDVAHDPLKRFVSAAPLADTNHPHSVLGQARKHPMAHMEDMDLIASFEITHTFHKQFQVGLARDLLNVRDCGNLFYAKACWVARLEVVNCADMQCIVAGVT